MEKWRSVYTTVADIFRLVKMNLSLNPKIKVLNRVNGAEDRKIPSNDIAVSVQRLILKLKGKYLSDDGKSVDYDGLKNDPIFSEFENLVHQFDAIDLNDLNILQRKAFFINVYNTLTIHGLANCDPLPKSVTDVNNFWRSTAYSINGMIFTLDDIEHGILRGNKRHPSSLSSQFPDSDPRLKFTMDTLDPRIHFVINCGAKSCPAIQVYKEDNLEQALNAASSNFLRNNVEISGNTVKLSKILMWYKSDFGADDKELLKWISSYVDQDHQEQLMTLVDSGQHKLVFSDYDWMVNAG